MIVYDLKCRGGHQFEAWFSNAAGYERLKKAGHVACSICGSTKVEKALNAPNIAPSKGKAVVAKPADAAAPVETAPREPKLESPASYANDPAATKVGELMKQLAEIRGQIEKNCDYVGGRFADEARKIHYGEAPKRNIYGEASDGDAKSLADEGVEFSRIPWAPRRDS
jgi:hypothetical protein